jgi:choline-sulfatase
MSNTIILMSDEHNPFVSSVYGHPMVKTPNMERMARMGTLFQSCYSPSPLCLPARSAFMSGRRVHDLQTYSNCTVNLSSDFPTYGAVLREQGVHSVHIGKTDVYDASSNLGFSEMLLNKDRPSAGDTNFRRHPLSIRKGAAGRASGYGVKEEAFNGDIKSVDTALNWLSSTAPTLDQPWSLTVNVLNPHFPQWNTQQFWDMYPDGGDLPKYGGNEPSGNHPYSRDLRDHFEADQFTEEQVRGLRRGYLSNVSFVDQQIGRLLDALEQSGQLANTNFIYTSDHGDMLGKFGLWWKCSLYEDSARVPCIAVGPDFAAGAVVTTPVDLHDVQASIFRATGAQRPADWVGMPLQDIPVNDKDRVVFAEYHGHGTRGGAFLIRKGDWKLLFNAEAPHQLFNLADDPDELNNVYDKFPDTAKELEQELRSICSPEKENDKAHSFQEAQLQVLKA